MVRRGADKVSIMTDPTRMPAGGADDPGEQTRLLDGFATPAWDDWQSEAERLLKGESFARRMFTNTREGLTLQPLYTRRDTADLTHQAAPPGFPPFARGARLWGRCGGGWEIAQEITAATAEECDALLRQELQGGLTAVVLPLDDASRQGLDPDRARVGEVGRGGVSIASAEALSRALAAVDLARTPVYLQSGASGMPYLGFYVAAARRRGVPPEALTGAIAMDPLGELARTGALPQALDWAYVSMAEMTHWACRHAPRLGTIWAHGEPYHDGGADAAQELALTLAAAVEYLRQLEARGVPPASAAAHVRWSLALGPHFFLEIAKLRAARLLWHQALAACGMPPQARALRLHARTGRANKSALDPHVNMLRATTEALAGVLGGADSLCVAPFDEPLRAADEFSRRLARNLQMIIRDEARMGTLADPGGGAWYLERTTADLAVAAWSRFQEIERRGGLGRALADGWPQAEVARAASARDRDAATGRRTLIGVNRSPNPDERPLPAAEPDWEELHARRARRLQAQRTSAPPLQEMEILTRLGALADADREAVAAAVIEAAAQGATLGEIVRSRCPDDGAAPRVEPIPLRRQAEPFERLRASVTAARDTGAPARVFLATLGPVARYLPRLDWTAAFFEMGGFATVRTAGHADAAAAASAALADGARAVAICGPDDAYPDQAPALARALKAAAPATVVILAGQPGDPALTNALREAGVDLFIHARVDAPAVLSELAVRLEVIA